DATRGKGLTAARLPPAPSGAASPKSTTSPGSLVRDGIGAALRARLEATKDRDYGGVLPGIPNDAALAGARLAGARAATQPNGHEPNTDEDLPRPKVKPHPKLPPGQLNAFLAALSALVDELEAP